MRIIVAGDVCPRNRVADYIKREDYGFLFDEVRALIESADYSIVNFESPVVKGDAKPIEKQGPNLKCTPKTVKALQWAGFNCMTLANNHFLDFGSKGVQDTITEIELFGLDHVGGGHNLTEAGLTLYKIIEGQTLAIINCCEHEFSIATKDTPGSNPLNLVRQYYSIQEAKKKADYVLVIVHGGHELFQLPSPRMVETYRFFIDSGADAVINHHQHCYSGYETYKGSPIIYGLGNFLFDISPVHKDNIWNYGMIAELSLSSSERSFKLYPYNQCSEEPRIHLLPEGSFDEKLSEINSLIADQDALEKAINKYYAESSQKYESTMEPFQSKFYFKLKRRGLLPSFIRNQTLVSIANYVTCEAHRDRFIWWLNNKANK